MQLFPEFKCKRLAEFKIKAFIKAWKVRKAMQNETIFGMRCLIRDLTHVQHHFVYVEKCDNMPLLDQLCKDRRQAVEDFADAVRLYSTSDMWLQGYIGYTKNEVPSCEKS